LTSIVL
jgi:hypothetical protein